jgi:hypothetical protein
MEEKPTLGTPTAGQEETFAKAEAHLKEMLTRARQAAKAEVDKAWDPSIKTLEERERELIAEIANPGEDGGDSATRQLCAVEESLGALRYSKLRSGIEMEQSIQRSIAGAMPRTAPRAPVARAPELAVTPGEVAEAVDRTLEVGARSDR